MIDHYVAFLEFPSLSGYDMIPGKGDLHDYWRDISTDGDFLGPPPSYTLIRGPVLRLCHRMMAHNIAGRSQAPEKVTVTDLFYLRGLDVGSFNIPYLLARYLRRFALGRKSRAHISGGYSDVTLGDWVAHQSAHPRSISRADAAAVALAVVTNSEKDKNKQNEQNRAREWKEYEKLRLKAYASLIG
ncbi:hypothetical protein Tco_0893792 [Tanacetum coccineum]|uniref:Uncharacterized protein n=1 Tax=Tanacetum coccineum TaxID=301880 RepID=A0ABQ5CAB5_9ASTR